MRSVEIPPGSDRAIYEEAIRTELTIVYGWGQLLYRNGCPLPRNKLPHVQEAVRTASDKATQLLEQFYNDCQQGGNGQKSDPSF